MKLSSTLCRNGRNYKVGHQLQRVQRAKKGKEFGLYALATAGMFVSSHGG